MAPLRFLPVLLVCASVVVAGCGGGSDSSSSSSSGDGAGAVTHVDGTITTSADGFELKLRDGGSTMSFTPGSSVEGATVKALEVSGAPARVSYRTAGDPPFTAVSVTAAPRIGEGLQTFTGELTKLSDTSLTLEDSDGKSRTFDISDADTDAFDVPHLKEHAAEHSPIKVYFDPKQPDAGIAYEDA